MSLVIALAMAGALNAANAGSARPFISVDDSDLSGPAAPGLRAETPTELTPDTRVNNPIRQGLEISLTRYDHEKDVPVTALTFTLTFQQHGKTRTEHATTDASGKLTFADCGDWGAITRLSATLRSELVEITREDNAVYEIKVAPRCGSQVELTFAEGSSGAQALGIWRIAEVARAKLDEAVGLSFWKKRLQFVWPSEGDYYSFGSVHISRGDHWDVVGHELGHAVYHMGNIGEFGGGSHKIDECYSTEMAFSEGWASFFSAWLSVSLEDADAKFEYMVPRRAPLRFETIPADVCRGEKNEWRVTGYLWDFLDFNSDGESSRESFARLWNALLNKRVRSAASAQDRMAEAGLDRAMLELVWDLNFLHSSD